MALWIHKNSCPKGSGAFVMWFHLHCPVKALVGSGVDWHRPHLNCHSVDRLDIDPPFSHPWIQEWKITWSRRDTSLCFDNRVSLMWTRERRRRTCFSRDGRYMTSGYFRYSHASAQWLHYTLHATHTMIRYPCSVQMCVVTMHTCHSRVFTIHTIHTSGGCPQKYQVIIYEIYDNITNLPLKYAAKGLF